MLRTNTLQITTEILALIAKIDEFEGAWRATMGEIIQVTGANRKTIKHHLRHLVENGHISQHGSGRGVWYALR